MENTTNKKKLGWWIGFAAVCLIALVMGVVSFFFLGGSPYQEHLTEIQKCLKKELNVDLVYIKDWPADSEDLLFETRTLFTMFHGQELPILSEKLSKDAWQNFEVVCDLNRRFALVQRGLIEAAKKSAAEGKPFEVVDLYDEKTLRFEDKAYKKKYQEVLAKEISKYNKAVKEEIKKILKN